MPSGYDFAIFGSGRLPALLAGLLAHDHGKQVLHVASSVSSQRLPRRIDVAFSLATRPATWRMLARATAETRALFASLDARDAVVPTDLQVVADRPGTRSALDHMRHIAASHGVRARGDRFLGLSRLAGDVSLADARVVSLDAERVHVGSGDANLLIDGERAEVGRIILADDSAILDVLPEVQRPTALQVQPLTASLVSPTRPLPAPMMLYPDRGVTLLQRSDRSVLALVEGSWDIDARLASCLPGPFPLRRLASTHYRAIVTADGAPVVADPAGSRITLIAGLGAASAFFAPALARWIAGVAGEDEASWFVPRLASRTERESVADFVPELLS